MPKRSVKLSCSSSVPMALREVENDTDEGAGKTLDVEGGRKEAYNESDDRLSLNWI